LHNDSYAMLRVCALLLSLSIVGGALPTGDDDVGTTSSAILNGDVDTSTPGVVAVIDRALGTVCSGVLVSERAVITARHCIAPIGSTVVDCASTAFGAETGAADVVVKANVEHAVARIVVPERSDHCGGDLAVVMLSEPLSLIHI